MNDNNVANITPVSGDPDLLDGKMACETITSAPPRLQQDARQQTAWRILVVDDDSSLAALEAEILAAYGYTVVTVHNGELAITTLRRSIPDLVVLDLELIGNLDGWAVFEELRSFSEIPVLITSSSATAVRPYMRSCGESRFTLDLLPKPYPMQTLLKRVRRMLPIVP